MKMIPLFKCKNMKNAVDFYTRILDFTLKHAEASVNDLVVDLINEDAELQLTVLESTNLYGSVINVWVDDVDVMFNKYLERGLDTSNKKNSPVHQGPLNQTWGTREFYVTDDDGNTLRFCRSL
jgi:uncharacterized glyoxalase superfamily protein PhnB